jgi:xanthine dehydrogenase accessory factor
MQSSDNILERAAALKARGQPFVLATVVRCESPTSAKPGAKAIVDASGQIDGWIGGGCAQPAVIATAKQALADGEARLIRVSPTKGAGSEPGIVDFGMTCHSGGTLDIFLEPIAARPSLLIIGASPSAQALSGLAARTGFDVRVLFPDATAALFPDAVDVIDGLDPALLGDAAPAFIVVATQGKRDEPGLDAALATGCGQIAFIASARKADKLKGNLLERGHDPARVAAIIAPAGVEIGAVTPEEIALSVLGGVVRARRSAIAADVEATQSQSETLPRDQTERQPQVTPSASCCGGVEEAVGDANAGAGSLPTWTGAVCCEPSVSAKAIDPVCGMTVEITDAVVHSTHEDADYYFCCGGCQQRFEQAPERFLPAAKTMAQAPA